MKNQLLNLSEHVEQKGLIYDMNIMTRVMSLCFVCDLMFLAFTTILQYRHSHVSGT